MTKIFSIVKHGKAIGTRLTPHRYNAGFFVVSKTRFEKDYDRITDESQLPLYVAQGYSVRMSNPDVPNHRSPSLIAPASIMAEET
jgi:hypothetical protein